MDKVLICEDATLMRGTLRLMLEKNGFEVVGEAENGKVAILKYKELRPDIVTMDISMPEMDGIAALREIFELDAAAKVIMISALGQESCLKEAIMLGAKGFLIKPFKEENLIESFRKILVPK